jgi:hypothetical protein
MLKSLASMLKKKSPDPPEQTPAPCARRAEIVDEATPIYKSLAMTEELRDALFPKTQQMVSAIFERPPASQSQAPHSPGSDDKSRPVFI